MTYSLNKKIKLLIRDVPDIYTTVYQQYIDIKKTVILILYAIIGNCHHFNILKVFEFKLFLITLHLLVHLLSRDGQ